MREIRFRYTFQHGETGRIFSTKRRLDDEGPYNEFPSNKYTLLGRDQFTGLHDKNGNEICEGDILSFVPIGHKKYNNPFKPFEVFWNEKSARFSDWSPREGDRGPEIIGNLYENPELLK